MDGMVGVVVGKWRQLYLNNNKKNLIKKKKHSSRLVGGAETGSWGWRGLTARWRLEDGVRRGGVVAGRQGGPTFACR